MNDYKKYMRNFNLNHMNNPDKHKPKIAKKRRNAKRGTYLE